MKLFTEEDIKTKLINIIEDDECFGNGYITGEGLNMF